MNPNTKPEAARKSKAIVKPEITVIPGKASAADKEQAADAGALMKRREVIIVPASKDTELDHRKDVGDARAVRAVKCLRALVEAAKEQVDFVKWVAEGGLDAEALLVALDRGGWHAALHLWEERKASSAANRPAPAPYELAARRFAVLMVRTLQQTGLGKHQARILAARELAAKKLFERAPTAKSIAHWEREQRESTAAYDEGTIAAAGLPGVRL
jgi:hypothetical protein